MTFAAAYARAGDDDEEFERFRCWDGTPGQPWVEEAENYIRVAALHHAEYVLAIRDDSKHLVGVVAFDRRAIEVPIVQPVLNPGWHLQVVALELDIQGLRLSSAVFESTFDAMRQLEPDRVLVTANVHKRHQASLAACERAGIEYLMPLDDDYVILLGEVPAPR